MNHVVGNSLFSFALLCAASAAPANAQPPDDGFAAFLRGDYATALRLLEPLANQGVPQAQYFLGLMYDVGQGVATDYPSAVKWYREAATAGVAPAQFNLGLMYEAGQGVPQDYVQAVMWLELAALHGSSAQRDESAKVRNRVAATMTAAQIAEAQRLAREWNPSPALQYRQPPKLKKTSAGTK